jgi:hypothetical protein
MRSRRACPERSRRDPCTLSHGGVRHFSRFSRSGQPNSRNRRVPHPSFFEGWDSAPAARDLSPTPAAPSTVERTDDPHHPPFSQSPRKGRSTWPHSFICANRLSMTLLVSSDEKTPRSHSRSSSWLPHLVTRDWKLHVTGYRRMGLCHARNNS